MMKAISGRNPVAETYSSDKMIKTNLGCTDTQEPIFHEFKETEASNFFIMAMDLQLQEKPMSGVKYAFDQSGNFQE